MVGFRNFMVGMILSYHYPNRICERTKFIKWLEYATRLAALMIFKHIKLRFSEDDQSAYPTGNLIVI